MIFGHGQLAAARLLIPTVGLSLLASATAANNQQGLQVYNDACVACHGSGIGGAPRLGDLDAWRSRVAQGRDILVDRVINGYTGNAGYMPPKGGRVDLADEDVLAAMAYLLDESS